MAIILFLIAIMIPKISIATELEFPYQNDIPVENAKKGTIPKIHTVIDGIKLNKTTLSEARSIFGAASSFRASDSSESGNDVLCYYSGKEKNRVALLLESGAMGGWKTITSFIMAPWEMLSEKARKRCAKSEKVNPKLSTRGGLRLGLPAEKLSGIGLSDPAVDSRGVMTFQYYSEQNAPYEKARRLGLSSLTERSIMSYVSMTLFDSKVYWFEVSWSE